MSKCQTNTESLIQSIYPRKLRWKYNRCFFKSVFQVPLSCSGCISETIHSWHRGLRFSGASSWCHYGLGGWATSTSTPRSSKPPLFWSRLPGKMVDFWEGWKKGWIWTARNWKISFFPDVNFCPQNGWSRFFVKAQFLCKVAPSTSLSQSMLGCQAGMLGLPEFSGFIFDLPCSSPSNWYLRSDIILCKKL